MKRARTLNPFSPPGVEARGAAEEPLAAYALKRGRSLGVLTAPPNPAPAQGRRASSNQPLCNPLSRQNWGAREASLRGVGLT